MKKTTKNLIIIIILLIQFFIIKQIIAGGELYLSSISVSYPELTSTETTVNLIGSIQAYNAPPETMSQLLGVDYGFRLTDQQKNINECGSITENSQEIIYHKPPIPTPNTPYISNIYVFRANVSNLVFGKDYYVCSWMKRGNTYFYSPVKWFKLPPKIEMYTVPSGEGNNDIPYGGSLKIFWRISGAELCTAEDDWSGVKEFDIKGLIWNNEIINNVRGQKTFSLVCDNTLGRVIYLPPNTIPPKYLQTNNKSITVTANRNVDIQINEILVETRDANHDTIRPDTTVELNGYVSTIGSTAGKAYGYFRLSKVTVPPLFCNEIFGSRMISVQSTKPNSDGSVSSGTSFSATAYNLTPDTQYAYCAFASNNAKDPLRTEIEYGNIKTFITAPCINCKHTTVKTLLASEIGTSLAKINGRFNTSRIIDESWFEYKEKNAPVSILLGQDGKKIEIGWNKTIANTENRKYGNFNFQLTNLKPNTIYQYRAFVKSNTDRKFALDLSQIFYGDILEFKTKAERGNPNVFDHCNNDIFEPSLGEVYVDEGGDCPLDPCRNGIQDFGETDIDVGGNCGEPEHCSNGILDEQYGETGIDEGGPCGEPEEKECEPPAIGEYPDCSCPDGYVGNPPEIPCEYKPICAPGQLEIAEGELCPAGYLGNAPCCDPYEKQCEPPGIWSYPETTGGQSYSPDDKICVCRSGYDGTPPNCTISPNPKCNFPEVGTYPDCTCASGYEGTPPDCEKINPDRVTVTVTADPNPINSGGKSTIKWSSTNAESCNANYPARGTGTSGSFLTETLTSNKTYTVTCKGKGGTGSNSVYVRVTKIKVDVTATPASVEKGKDSTISWTSQGATYCHSGFIELLRDDPQKLKYERISIANNEISGSVKVKNITEAKSFTVACGNEYDDYAEDSATISIKGINPNLKDKITVTVSANPKVIYPKKTSTITWTSTNAEKCNASYPDTGEGARTKGTSGSFSTGPLEKSKSYSVTCTGKNGTGSGSTFVQVIKNLIQVDVWAKPQTVSKGGNTTIYWKADEKATACDSGVRSASKATDTSKYGGFSPINIQQAQNYVVTCTGPDEAWGEGKTKVNIGGKPLHCSNKKLDADLGETEIDKGGPCGGGKPLHCYNEKLDADLGETAVDVGGPCGKPAHCFDNVLSGDETEVDKGGSCGGGKPSHCYNNKLDADLGETSVDAGGPCGKPAHCYNYIKDADETGIDIGGSCGSGSDISCPKGWTKTSTGCVGPEKCPTGTTGIFPNCTFINKCPAGMTGTYPNCKTKAKTCPIGFNFVEPDKCVAVTECPEGTKGTYPKCTFIKECPSGTTGEYPNCGKTGPSENGDCSDKIKNGNETGIDTGGRCDPNFGKLCPSGFSGVYPNCVEDGPTVLIDHCINEVQDFGEIAVDIGGGCGGVYPKGPNCYDNIKNGDETSVDKGGHCGDDRDNKGEFPSCFDNIKNGDETEIDKGGHCGGELKSNRIDIRVPDFEGTGIINGTCKDKAIVGNAIATSPGSSNGPFEGVWYAGKAINTGNIKLNCKDGSCEGTLQGKVVCMDGPFVGSLFGGKGDGSNNKKVDWIDMVFEGYSGLGIINGNCVNGVCDSGEFSGIMPEVNSKVSERWYGPQGTGPFGGECKGGVCSGIWSGVITGNNGPVTGTWTGNGSNEKAEELYIGYEGMPDVDDIVRYHEGIEHVFIRRIMINTELARKYGYKREDNLLYFAWKLAHDFAKEFGYVNKEGNEIRVSKPDVSAYQLRQVGNELTVYEYYKNKIIDIRKTTSVFKDKNSYEYYFEK